MGLLRKIAAISVIAAAALMFHGGGAAQAAVAPQASGGGCVAAANGGYRVSACISAQSASEILPDMYITNVASSNCIVLYQVVHNGLTVNEGQVRCAVGHLNLGPFSGTGTWYTEVQLESPSDQPLIDDQSQPEFV